MLSGRGGGLVCEKTELKPKSSFSVASNRPISQRPPSRGDFSGDDVPKQKARDACSWQLLGVGGVMFVCAVGRVTEWSQILTYPIDEGVNGLKSAVMRVVTVPWQALQLECVLLMMMQLMVPVVVAQQHVLVHSQADIIHPISDLSSQ
jgi:hypothetical protein